VTALSRADILRRFGENLREARQRTGLSQEKLAAKAGIDRTYVGGAERGERNVALVNIVRLAEALEIAPADLLKGLDANG
jgi:transcriptional regulator with XRE-family HTH domain